MTPEEILNELDTKPFGPFSDLPESMTAPVSNMLALVNAGKYALEVTLISHHNAARAVLSMLTPDERRYLASRARVLALLAEEGL